MKKLFGLVAGVLGTGGAVAFYFGFTIGWLYWVWVGVQLGSFGMVLFALLGPFALIAAVLGLWSFLFGIPLWLLHVVR